MTSQQLEIIRAIEEELRSSGRQRRFTVVSAVREKSTIRIAVRPQRDGGKLDRTLEDGIAAWGNWQSSVVSVSLEEGAIYVHRVDAPVPVPDMELRVQPPRFLDSLLDLWKKEELATKCFSWAANAFVGHERRSLALCPSFPELRDRQRAAYSLLSYQAGFLWGPPGTGKTTTAGAMVADLITSDTNARVLLIASTNTAVDKLLIAMDDHLSCSRNGQIARKDCARVGSNFVAGHYEGRRHLLPTATDEVVLRKARLEAARPGNDEVEAKAQWQREMESILAELRCEVQAVLKGKRVVAMTATLATMYYTLLQDLPFDLVVFDEASQLGRAVSLMLAPLARRALIAGDPYQLAPIFTSKHPFVERWFGRTLFDKYMQDGHSSTCFLNEQSRMAGPICGLVSSMFYSGGLQVSQDSLANDGWRAARQPLRLLPAGRESNLHLVDIGTESVPYGSSHRRLESAKAAAEVAQQLGAFMDPKQILILTPFVSQQNLIRQVLKERGMRRVRASTVHAAQGSEVHSVIFDPVKASGPLWNARNGRRLLNVAISRAQACFVLLASAGDVRHPLVSGIADQIRGSDSSFLRDTGPDHLGA